MKVNRDEAILQSSNRLFIKNGYDETTMRQIANDAEVSVGLTTYHFATKRQIAVTVMERYLRYLKSKVADKVRLDEEPLVLSAAFVRLCIEFFMSGPSRRFYLQCLRHDIYMEAMQRLGIETSNSIARTHRITEDSPDILLLFDNYIPPTVEKILLLEKERGNFAGIDYDQIPEIVFAISVERNIERDAIREAADKGRTVSEKILSALPKDLHEQLFAIDRP